MAWFNPQAVQFNPSGEILKSASAIGDTLQSLYKQNYQEAQDNQRNKQLDRAYDFQVDRANTQDRQWNEKFVWDKEKYQTDNEIKMADNLRADMRHAEDLALRNKQLGISQSSLGLQQQEAQRKNDERQAQGLFVADLYPQLAQKFGVSNVKVPTREEMAHGVTQGNIPKDIVSIDPTKAGQLSGVYDMAKAEQIAKYKENDPYKLFMANLAGEKFKETQKTNEDKEAYRTENEKLKRAAALQKQFSNNPKSVLGIDPADLSDKDYQLFINDMNEGKLGKLGDESVDGFFGKKTIKRYFPAQEQMQQGTQGKTILERRQTKDGKILVKYSDGTIGEQ